MSKFQPPMLNNDVCRAPTDKQTHKHTHTHTQTYIQSKNWGNLFYGQIFYFLFFLLYLFERRFPIDILSKNRGNLFLPPSVFLIISFSFFDSLKVKKIVSKDAHVNSTNPVLLMGKNCYITFIVRHDTSCSILLKIIFQWYSIRHITYTSLYISQPG